MAALPNRLLRLLNERPEGLTYPAAIDAFPAYRRKSIGNALIRLLGAHLATYVPPTSPELDGAYSILPAGRAVLTLPTPPRWAPARRSLPRTAPIAR